MRRWISWVRPPILPLSLSRGVRVTVDRGSMAYSAVTQPRPELRSQPGTPGSMVALVSTRVFPRDTRTDPSAVWTKLGVSASARSSWGARPPGRKKASGIPALYRPAAGDGADRAGARHESWDGNWARDLFQSGKLVQLAVNEWHSSRKRASGLPFWNPVL